LIAAPIATLLAGHGRFFSVIALVLFGRASDATSCLYGSVVFVLLMTEALSLLLSFYKTRTRYSRPYCNLLVSRPSDNGSFFDVFSRHSF